MDILKILSRGTKPNPKNQAAKGSAAAVTAATKLPSAGAIPRPQLFNDPVSSTPRGKKRKRKNKGGDKDGDDDAQNNEDEDLSDVDFFAPPKPKSETGPQQHTTEEDGEPEKRKNKKRKVKTLDEDECKQILRSHRLKFTLLSSTSPTVAELEAQAEAEGKKKKKKKSKKGEESKEEKEKETKKSSKLMQLWPQPLTAFGQLKYDYGINQTLADNITRQGFKVPTEVQMGALPLLLQPGTALGDKEMDKGVDFLAVAPTGSGKTIAFLIPAIEGVLKARGEVQEGDGIKNELRAIVVAPTRELASQIVNEGRKLAIGTGVRVVLMKRGLRLQAEGGDEQAEAEEDSDSEEDEEKQEEQQEDDEGEEEQEDSDEEDGGDKKKDQKEKPLAKVDILVTTPKILLNFLSDDGKLTSSKKTLPTVRSLILDEADVLLDPIFRKQTMAIWKSCVHPDVALTCWSATMASNIEALVTKHLSKRAKHFNISRPLIRLVVGLKDTAVPNVTHKLIYTATEQGKLLALRQLLHPASSSDSGPPLRPPFIVFTQTIDRAKALHKELQFDIPLEAGGSARIAVLHSSLSDQIRSKIMAKFRSGEVWVLITTDVLARGVDFAGVNGVVNYDVPTSAAGYVHRAGRTGRAGREGGVAVTFYTKEDIPFVKSVANVIAASEKQAGKTAAGEESVKKWLLDALPKVAKEDKRKLKVRGVEARRAGGKEASITTQSSWERRKENNKRQAIEASKKRKRLAQQAEKQDGGADKKKKENDEEWGGLDD
ncbi:putative ATP-dependent RNA helicase [Triangularia verruculosa]|uniref:ATP-dependent RNA helicase ROK1 n=1 Tax=Triangularia verruculosa TaxID=2587418 RepID=A0AAN6XQS5_9PEZI|nr:putative ATP-dependent RNA helicase [Triangularia verruculosa]